MKHPEFRSIMDLCDALENETVTAVGYREPDVVNEGEPVGAAVNRMRENMVGCLLVLQGGRLSGIFTERDLVTRVLGREDVFDRPIEEFMTREPTVAYTEEPIHRVLARMHAEGVRHLPVLNETDRPVGTISVKSVVHFLAEYHPTAVYNLPPNHGQISSSRDGG